MFPHNFIDKIIQQAGNVDLKFRFPPEPSGHLHIGHIKSMAINFSFAQKYGGTCYLRFDDTNPETSKLEYVEQIIRDIHWLGFAPDKILYTSDYFAFFEDHCRELLSKQKAYVCDLPMQQIQEYRGTLTQPGIESPYRSRSVTENLQLFEDMQNGKCFEGSRVIRAKINMSSGNLNLRDPVLMRIKMKVPHYRHGFKTCLYPSYDFSHPLSDAYEAISHSLCSLEFEDHRPLYNWVLENCDVQAYPMQIEFSRLNISDTITSKRQIRSMIQESEDLNGFSDPRLDTISGLRNRGYSAAGLLNFCYQTGVSKQNSCISRLELEKHQRWALDKIAMRKFVILDPLPVKIIGLEEKKISLQNHPDLKLGNREISISSEIVIERQDFVMGPLQHKERKWSPGGVIVLLGSIFLRCVGYDTNPGGQVTKVYGEVVDSSTIYDAVLSWVDHNDNISLNLIEVVDREIRQYKQAVAENSLSEVKKDTWIQAYRLGYLQIDDPIKLVVRLKSHL